jgi:hypothetical protein
MHTAPQISIQTYSPSWTPNDEGKAQGNVDIQYVLLSFRGCYQKGEKMRVGKSVYIDLKREEFPHIFIN